MISKRNEIKWDYDFWILGEPASAKNQRQLVKIHGVSRLIKSRKALLYSKTFKSQCPLAIPLMEGDVALRIDVFYYSRRPDLACEELIKDLLEDRLYPNDKQVKAQMAIWNLDNDNPRCRIRLRELGTKADVNMSTLKQSEIWPDDD